ncbi:MAG TPA: YfhO family protein [Patescibacteria group bacterium]|nr:YfhO family protein [Patescibacteria group bacterium]
MKKTLLGVSILVFVCLAFFWPISKGLIPFPGDLLVDNNPYRSLSILGFNPGAYPNKAQGMDVITEMYPWRFFTIQQLKQGKIPFWNPHNFSGNIHMQNLQSSVFNPLNLLFFPFSFPIGWTLFILIQPILASIFFYAFARELRVSRFASVLGAIGFALSSYMTVWIEYGNIAATLAYLPLLLFFLLRFLKKEHVKDYCGFIIAAVLMLLSGYIQGAFYSYTVAVFFVFYFFIAEKKKPTPQIFLSLSGMFLFPLFLTLFQFLPTLTIFSQSTRWPYSLVQLQNLLQPWWYWVTLFASDFFGNPATRNYYLPITYIERVTYIGIPLLLFAIIGIFQKRQFVRFFLFLAVVVMLLTTNFPGVAYFYKLPIPVINTTVPTRMLSIFMFAMVVLAMFGIDEFFTKKKFPKKVIGGFCIIFTLLWAGLLFVGKIYPQFLLQTKISEHNLIIPTILFLATSIVLAVYKKFALYAKIFLFILVVADLFYVFQKITPFAPAATIYPVSPVVSYMQQNGGINRYWGYGSGYINPNFQTIDGTYSPEGNDPLHIKNYGDLLASSYDGKIPLLPPRPDANIAPGYGQDGMQNHFRQTLLNLLGVKYVVQHDESREDNNPDYATFPKEIYQLTWGQNPWQIYENKKALPRFFLANSYMIAKGQKALDALYSVDLSKIIVLNTQPKIIPSSTAQGKVVLRLYDTQKIVFSTETNGPMLLFLSDAYYASWHATIDGKPVDLLLADYAFRAVPVPSGKHIIVMYYSSISFSLGILISGVAFIFFLGSLPLLKKYEKNA